MFTLPLWFLPCGIAIARCFSPGESPPDRAARRLGVGLGGDRGSLGEFKAQGGEGWVAGLVVEDFEAEGFATGVVFDQDQAVAEFGADLVFSGGVPEDA